MTSRLDPSLIPPAPNLDFENLLWEAGIQRIAGIDEAGRGALAGPVAASAVILFPRVNTLRDLRGVRDSKEMTPAQRESWASRIPEIALACGVGFATPVEIDALGIVPATRLAASRALQSLAVQPSHLLLDYLFLPDNPLPQTVLIKGDARSLSIASASILAKTARDALMRTLDGQCPGYGFAAHKGYGTAAHRQAITRLGPSPVHRMSFAPMRFGVEGRG
ncbi:MAG: ribonuclease HII [Chloroflexi bacterium]|nr:ribonuclease HII [Chloroflexota bacterium]